MTDLIIINLHFFSSLFRRQVPNHGFEVPRQHSPIFITAGIITDIIVFFLFFRNSHPGHLLQIDFNVIFVSILTDDTYATRNAMSI